MPKTYVFVSMKRYIPYNFMYIVGDILYIENYLLFVDNKAEHVHSDLRQRCITLMRW